MDKTPNATRPNKYNMYVYMCHFLVAAGKHVVAARADDSGRKEDIVRLFVVLLHMDCSQTESNLSSVVV